MRNLAEDRAEFNRDNTRAHAWLRRKRRRHGIAPDEPATWFVYVDQRRPYFERHMVGLFRSPVDALDYASLYAKARGYYQEAPGRWLIERIGEEGIDSPYLIVVPEYDPEGYPPQDEEEGR